MKIINRKMFLLLPRNTLFAKYEPCVFGNLMIKMDTIHNDWFEQRIVDAVDCDDSKEFTDKLESAQLNGEPVDMDFDCVMRDGCFEPDDELFAVFEKKDVKQLIERLKMCLD